MGNGSEGERSGCPHSGRSPTTQQPQVSVGLPDPVVIPTTEPHPEQSQDRRLTNPIGGAADIPTRGFPGHRWRRPGSSCSSMGMGHQPAAVFLLLSWCYHGDVRRALVTWPTTPVTLSDRHWVFSFILGTHTAFFSKMHISHLSNHWYVLQLCHIWTAGWGCIPWSCPFMHLGNWNQLSDFWLFSQQPQFHRTK